MLPESFCVFLVLCDELPECLSVAVAPVKNFLHCVDFIHICIVTRVKRALHADDLTTTYAVICPLVVKVSVKVDGRNLHSVRMHLQECLRLPLEFDLSSVKSLNDRSVCKVALACSCQ